MKLTLFKAAISRTGNRVASSSFETATCRLPLREGTGGIIFPLADTAALTQKIAHSPAHIADNGGNDAALFASPACRPTP